MKYLAAAVSKVRLIGVMAQTGVGLVDPSNHFQGPHSQSPFNRDSELHPD